MDTEQNIQDALTFDIVVHLAGEQILPNFIGMQLCKTENHVLVVSEQTRRHVGLLKTAVKSTIQHLVVNPFEYHSLLKKFEEIQPAASAGRIGFNVTGGTKPMSVAAIDICRRFEIAPFYIDTSQKKIFFFDEPFNEFVMPEIFDNVATFVRLAGYSVNTEGIVSSDEGVTSRRSLTEQLFTHHKLVRQKLPEIAKFTDKKNQNLKNAPTEWTTLLSGLLSDWAKKASQISQIWQMAFPTGHDWRIAARYLAGGWFEEYCLLKLSEDDSKKDVRAGMMPGWIGAISDPRNAAQELDVAYTDGFRLTIVECKTGQIKQEHFQKLENLTATFGGAFGGGILASLNKPTQDIVERVKSARNVTLIWGSGLADLNRSISIAKENRSKIYPSLSK